MRSRCEAVIQHSGEHKGQGAAVHPAGLLRALFFGEKCATCVQCVECAGVR